MAILWSLTPATRLNVLECRMMSENTIVFNKVLFMTTHPPFDGERFNLWKARMDIFIEANDIDMRVTIKKMVCLFLRITLIIK